MIPTPDTLQNAVDFIAAIQAGQLNGIAPADCGQYADILSEAERAFELDGQEAALKVIATEPDLLRLAAGGIEPTTPPALTDAGQWLTVTQILKAHYRGEIGDAELLAQLYANRLVFDHSEKTWFLWAGHYWQPDDTRQAANLIGNQLAAQYLHTAAELQKTADDNAGQEQVKKLQKRAGSLRYRAKITNVLTLAQSQPALALAGPEWEQQPLKLAVQNGVIDLETGSFEPGRPVDLIRTAAPVTWQGIDAPAPRWEQFLQEIFAGDSELIAFVQRLFGYAITGQVTEHILPILWGHGRNGKETLLETIKAVLGDLAAPAGKDVLMESRRDPGAATPHLYALRPLRLAWVSETRAGSGLNVEQVKWLTGGGTLTARPLHGNPVTFTPRYTLLMITNHKPKADADDYALWQRLLLIPFKQSFVTNPTAANEHKADGWLAEKLRSEAAGILAWLVRGCLDWQQNGLNPPQSVRLATKVYQKEEDDLSQFISECCTTGPGLEVKASEFFKAYKSWCESYGEKPRFGSRKFGQEMTKRYDKDRASDNNGLAYFGVGLLANPTQQKKSE